jgi:hypothetical protein
VGDGSEEFGAVAFFLEWEVIGGFADEVDGGCMEFPFLALGWGWDEFAVDLDGGAGAHLGEVFAAGDADIGDDLEVSEAGSVVEFDEGECFGVAAGADPSGDVEVIAGFFAVEDVFDEGAHGEC